jgi:preprotein translocase subunit SecB
MPTQPKSSPLTILSHEFIIIELRATDSEQLDGELQLSTDQAYAVDPDDELHRSCELTIHFGPADQKNAVPYEGKIKIRGVFSIAETYNPENPQRRKQLMEVTATSILYGSCREMVANLTARAPHGLLSLPSVSFFDPKKSPINKVAKKVAKKKTEL